MDRRKSCGLVSTFLTVLPSPLFRVNRGLARLSHEACAPTSELEGSRLPVPRELAHGNQSFAANILAVRRCNDQPARIIAMSYNRVS